MLHDFDSLGGPVELLQVVDFVELGPRQESLPGLWLDWPGSPFLNLLSLLRLLFLNDLWLQHLDKRTLDGSICPLAGLWN